MMNDYLHLEIVLQPAVKTTPHTLKPHEVNQFQPGTLRVCALTGAFPVAVGVRVVGDELHIERDGFLLPEMPVQIMLTGRKAGILSEETFHPGLESAAQHDDLTPINECNCRRCALERA